MSHDHRYFLANEAGQAAAIATVSAVTGEHIDHFAEVNLAGFYALAQAFHGIEACVKPWDGGRNLLEFANEMHALTGKNLTLSTLPIVTTQNGVMVNGVAQDVDIVNLPYVSHLVQSAFSQPAQDTAKKPAARKKPAGPSSIPPPSTVTVDVYNGGTTNLLAAAVSQALVAAGYRAGATGSPAAQSQTVQAATQVFYGTGAAANAKKIAGYFGATATAASSVAAGHVEILLGTTSTAVPAGLGASSSSPASAPAASATSAANNGQAGGAVTVKANARYGIPCVY
jgi:hypothetical protein